MIIDVLILYEHVARELESALLLKRLLKREKLNCVILKAHWNDGLMHLKYRPKIIVTPWCYDNEEIEDLCSEWRGGYPGDKIKIINLHCEQLANSNGLTYLIPKDRAKDTYHLVWGNYFKEILLKQGVEEKSIVVTGSPRLDFFRPEYRSLNKTKIELANNYNLNPNWKWVLLIGNFSAKNVSDEEIARAERKEYNALDQMVKLTKESYSAIVKWFAELLSRDENREGIEFIYRPHPNETITDEITALEKNTNFHVIKDLSIKDWIVNSDAAFGWCSTSSVEVVTAEVPIFNLRPFEIPESMRMPLVDDIEIISSAEEFNDILRMIRSDEIVDVNDLFKSSISYYYNQSEKSAAEITCDFIKDIYDDEDRTFNTRYNYVKGGIKTIRYCIKASLIKMGIVPKSVSEIVLNDVRASSKYKVFSNKINDLELK